MLDLLLPQRCLGCAAAGAQLCGPCVSSLRRIGPPICARCGAPTAWPVARCRECAGRRLAYASARAAVEYDAPVRKIVAAWKEHGLRRMGVLAAEIVVDVLAAPRADAVAFVPPERDRRLRRGHHAPEVLARELGARWGLPVAPLLARTRTGRRQRGLTGPERRANVRGAFRADRAPPRILLVDDVYTTGATVHASASALRSAGARRVEVVTFARAIRIR
ncbi:MAG TPA: double zinc ribbon domain-containing protein [Gaiellaceae bacterium]|nr:double zinc ribbon domain-containing protein [Gaiellaceae bacterium]